MEVLWTVSVVKKNSMSFDKIIAHIQKWTSGAQAAMGEIGFNLLCCTQFYLDEGDSAEVGLLGNLPTAFFLLIFR